MSITIEHPGVDGDSTPAWAMSYTLKALMGDRRLRDCTLTIDSASFHDDQRSTAAMPFVIPMSAWSDWSALPNPSAARWWLGRSNSRDLQWRDYHDVVVLDDSSQLRYARLRCGAADGDWELISRGTAGEFTDAVSMQVVSRPNSGVDIVAVNRSRLVIRTRDAVAGWSQDWADIAPTFVAAGPTGGTVEPVPLDDRSTVAVEPEGFLAGGPDLYVTGSDNCVYRAHEWRVDPALRWDQIACTGFTLAPSAPVQVVNGRIFALSDHGEIWTVPGEPGLFVGWQAVSPAGAIVARFAVSALTSGAVCLAACDLGGNVQVSVDAMGSEPGWTIVGGGLASTLDDLAWAIPADDDPWLFAVGGAIGSPVAARPGTNSPPVWHQAGAEATNVAFGGSVAATSRARGQVEVFTMGDAGSLMTAWWS
jgi:hypothetical protein